jgi:hypothetical protein
MTSGESFVSVGCALAAALLSGCSLLDWTSLEGRADAGSSSDARSIDGSSDARSTDGPSDASSPDGLSDVRSSDARPDARPSDASSDVGPPGIEFVGAINTTANAAASITLHLPAGAAANDVAWIAVYARGGTLLSTTWTSEFAGASIDAGTCGGYNSAYLGKVLSPSDVTTGSVTVDFKNPDDLIGSLSVFRGAQLASISMHGTLWFEVKSVPVNVAPGFEWVAAVSEYTGTWGAAPAGLNTVYAEGVLAVYEGPSTRTSLVLKPPQGSGNCGSFYAVTLDPL